MPLAPAAAVLAESSADWAVARAAMKPSLAVFAASSAASIVPKAVL